MSKDKFLVTFIFGVALAAGIVAWVYQYNKSLQVLNWLGPEQAHLVTNADAVELLEFAAVEFDADSSNTLESITLIQQDWPVSKKTNVTNWNGLVHARYMLSVDVSYQWGDPVADDADIQCAYALRFISKQSESGPLLIGFDPIRRVAVCGAKVVAMGEMADQLTKYLFETTDH